MTQQGQWQLTGNAAEMYEQTVVPYQLKFWASELVEQMDLQPGEHVLDVACGTGIVARFAAEKVGASGGVTGLDLNSGMLAVGRSLELPKGASEITWVECSAVDMHLEDESFDVALCQQGFQFFPDKPAAVRELHRILRHGGRLAISVWYGPSPYSIAMVNGIERHLGSEAAHQQRAASRIVPSADEMKDFLVEGGFRGVQVNLHERTRRLPHPEKYVPMHLGALPVSAQVLALSEDARSAMVQDIADELRPYVEGDELVFLEATNIATARK
jgi:ubiquinone/menaquinone biosynthesis C-methylase UbiE